MAQPNRTALLGKLQKVLKKHYKPAVIVERSLLEHLLFACCLENAPYEAAEKAYAAISTGFFDWNEVRVTTVKELSELMPMLPDPTSSAANIKRILYGVFESKYSYDMEWLKKQNVGQAIQQLKKYEGATPFSVAFVTQAALGGHAIPLDRGTMEAMAVLGLAGEADLAEFSVPGLERAIPKSKGMEFGTLVHQLGADMAANPYSPALHKLLLEISPECKERLPKRPPKTPPPPPKVEAKPAAKKKDEVRGKPAEAAKPTAERPAAKPAAAKADKHAEKAPEKPTGKAPDKPSAKAEKHAAEKPAKKDAKSPAAKKKAAPSAPAKRKPR